MALASYYVNEVPRVSPGIPSGSTSSPRMCQRYDEYRQASSEIRVCRRLVHTIDWIIWV
ncbi:hypothetical protein F383_29121 [Gossypium arboreum]|uniref:Uncharacterized protein n=1 Tax=Gossypium arboreum TaxID=29729 RepID=A0A0B0MZC8_GOSAR|nr:hypothetical protein F383_29121 [Gossypium arboreum]